MTHSELLELRASVEAIDVSTVRDSLQEQEIKFLSVKTSSLTGWPIFHKDFQDKLSTIGGDLYRLEEITKVYIEKINQHLDMQTENRIELENMFCTKPTYLFKTTDFVRKVQILDITPETEELVKARIGYYVDWRYPALELGPGDGKWTKELVGCDPLYLVDYNNEFLNSTVSQFNPQYQKRIRCYTNMGYRLHMLPQNQFGLVFCWNMFNYLALDHINHYLAEIFNVLRPGGTAIISYNNVERINCAMQSDNNFMTHIPKKHMVDKAKALGFVEIRAFDEDSLVSWIEIRKPGIIQSQRFGQTLGKIIKRQSIKE